MARSNRKEIRVPRMCTRKDGRHYVTDPRTKKQEYLIDQDDYERWRADFLDSFRQAALLGEPVVAHGSQVSVLQFCKLWMDHARSYYRKDGEPTSQVQVLRSLARALPLLHGERSVNSLRSSDIELLMERMVADGRTRRGINDCLSKIKRMFRWGVRRDLVSGDTLGRIEAVGPLKQGRTRAREKAKIKPAPEESIAAVLEELPATPRTMLLLQRYAGMRPGEVCRLRPDEIDRSGETWQYRPERYKTQHRHEDNPEKRRRIWLGKKCRELLTPLLGRAPLDKPLFRTQRHRQFTERTYRLAIWRACDRAGVPRFSPNRVRHSTGTDVRRIYGIEAARAYLGHENMKSSEIYAERDDALARRIAEELG